MQTHDQLATMDAQQLRVFAAGLLEQVGRQDQELHRRQLKIDQLTHEMAVMRRWKFAAHSEQLHGEQRHLFEEAIEADLEALGLELSALTPAVANELAKQIPRRA